MLLKLLKKLSIIVLAFFIPLRIVWAQESTATSDIEIRNEYSETSIEIEKEIEGESKESTNEIVSKALETLELKSNYPGLNDLLLKDTQLSELSNWLKKPTLVHELAKKDFSTEEKVSVIVENTLSTDTKIKFYDSNGQEVAPDSAVINPVNPTVLTFDFPRQGKAGRYRMEIIDPEGNSTLQDFTWGVLALNTNKPTYKPNETAAIAIAVLDEVGMMVCDANVELKIQSPSGQKTILSTETSEIKAQPECYIKDFTLKPDYEAIFQVTEVGQYSLQLRATTSNGTYSITDSFNVEENPNFEIERITATRLFPPKTYPMTFEIKFNKDFEGKIVEKVPSILAISPQKNIKGYDEIKTNADLATTNNNTEKFNIPTLALPFDGNFPISQTFGSPPDDPILEEKYKDYGVVGHDGIDFATPENTPVLAVDEGEVIAIAGDYGNTIVIKHEWGQSYYGHLNQITAQVGDYISKQHPIGLSGNTGLATSAHLHLGIKPNDNDINNGYYGKINPLQYLELMQENEEGYQFTTGAPLGSNAETELIWNVSAKKGEKIKLGYEFKAPNISPQFYLLGKAQLITNTTNEVALEESRFWQLAIDADGSGTATVTPNYGEASTTGNTYTFTYTATENMGSGSIQLTIPSGWSTPQGNVGTAGYTLVTTTGNAYVGTYRQPMESAVNWIEESGQTDVCNTTATPALDSTNKKQGTYSISCNNSASTAPDSGDTWGYNLTPIGAQNWSSYTRFGVWFRVTKNITATGSAAISFFTSNLNTLATGGRFDVYTLNGSSTLSANTWYWLTGDLTGVTRTAITGYGVEALSNTGTDSCIINLDNFLLGSQSTTSLVSGSGPWTSEVYILNAQNTETITFTYGSGGGTSGVTNSATTGTHTFTTKSNIASDGTLTDIAQSPFVTIIGSNANLLRHNKWFDSAGTKQPFIL